MNYFNNFVSTCTSVIQGKRRNISLWFAIPSSVFILASSYFIIAHRNNLIEDTCALFYSQQKRDALRQIGNIEAGEALFRGELKETSDKYIVWKEQGGELNLALKKSVMELHMDLDFFFNKIDEIVSGNDEYVRFRRKGLVDQFKEHAILLDLMLTDLLSKE